LVVVFILFRRESKKSFFLMQLKPPD
jgi:hypothetical protein